MNIKVALSRQENLEHYGVNEVDLEFEEYLKGVVPSEIGNALLEACKAQAVAARTFALYTYTHKGYITDQSSKHQAFRASRISSLYPNAMLAVEETKGEVLYYNGKLIETCSYSNSNGGRIKSAKEKWGGDRPYLQAKIDPYDNGPGNGHGVGMSQYGAKEMAKQGFNYKQILEFYYPGTVIYTNYGEAEKCCIQPSQPDKIEVKKMVYQAKVTGTSGSTVNLRKGPGTQYGVVTTIRFGQIVDVLAVEGDWSAIEWNDKSGYMSNKYLVKVNGSESKEKWYVKLECDSEAQAKAIAAILAKAKATA